MNCQQSRSLLDAYADGELDAANILELERHIKECPDCARAAQNLRGLKTALKGESLYFSAPKDFHASLRKELREAAGVRPWWRDWGWPSLSAALPVACVLVLLLVIVRPSRSGLAQEVVDNHIRSLMANHVLDVVSTDQHTVKPWFNGKLDFAPPVKDLAAQEFPLIGGRLDYLDNHTVAALIFHRQKHVINLFIWPTTDKDSAPAAVAVNQGYHVVRWNVAGMTFWAVSDLNEKELLEFAQDYNRG